MHIQCAWCFISIGMNNWDLNMEMVIFVCHHNRHTDPKLFAHNAKFGPLSVVKLNSLLRCRLSFEWKLFSLQHHAPFKIISNFVTMRTFYNNFGHCCCFLRTHVRMKNSQPFYGICRVLAECETLGQQKKRVLFLDISYAFVSRIHFRDSCCWYIKNEHSVWIKRRLTIRKLL